MAKTLREQVESRLGFDQSARVSAMAGKCLVCGANATWFDRHWVCEVGGDHAPDAPTVEAGESSVPDAKASGPTCSETSAMPDAFLAWLKVDFEPGDAESAWQGYQAGAKWQAERDSLSSVKISPAEVSPIPMPGVAAYRKKPVVVEALQWTGNDQGIGEMLAFCPTMLGPWEDAVRTRTAAPYLYIFIPTLEGDHRAEPGDWIIKGVKGEFYPCKPDIFAMTYEPVTASESGIPAHVEPTLPSPTEGHNPPLDVTVSEGSAEGSANASRGESGSHGTSGDSQAKAVTEA